MKVAVLVPGIMGTRLSLDGEEVWPPTPLETRFGYRRVDKLTDPRVEPKELIFNILSFQFYGTIRDRLFELGYSPDGGPKRYVDFPYDWRRDLFDTVDVLAERLKTLHEEGADEIAIVSHSMGGLITRLMLEGGKFDGEAWFKKINLFVALAVPHLGAPLAIARIFGIDSTLGISGADFAKLARNKDYPSGYQLIPAPGEQPIWDLASSDIAALDCYDATTATKLGMVPDLVARAKAVHDVLSKRNKPAGIRYFYFAGVGHKTVTRINVRLGDGALADHAHSISTQTPDGGDGTVPIYSALPHLGQRQLVVNEHSTVFEGTPFKKVFVRLFGGDAGAPVETAGGDSPNMMVALSIDSPVQAVGKPIETTLNIIPPATGGNAPPKPPSHTAIKGNLVLDLVSDEGRIEMRGFRETPITYDGPGITRLTVNLPAVEEPGLFLLRFAGSVQAENDVRFAVSRAAQAP